MKKVKMALATLAVIVAVFASLATKASRGLASFTVSFTRGSNFICTEVGTCTTNVTPVPLMCKTASGAILFNRMSATSCGLVATGTYHPIF